MASLRLDPELAYEIVEAAFGVVGSVSPDVHRRNEAKLAAGEGSNDTKVSWWHLVELRQALNKIPPGGLADKTSKAEAARRARR